VVSGYFASRTVIRSILFRWAQDNDYHSIVECFEQAGVWGRSSQQPGCQGGEIQLPIDGESPLTATALWDSADAYPARVDDPWPEESNGVSRPLREERRRCER
jgi:hypothetical protein